MLQSAIATRTRPTVNRSTVKAAAKKPTQSLDQHQRWPAKHSRRICHRIWQHRQWWQLGNANQRLGLDRRHVHQSVRQSETHLNRPAGTEPVEKLPVFSRRVGESGPSFFSSHIGTPRNGRAY